MAAFKFVISVDRVLMERLDDFVQRGYFLNRSTAFQTAFKDKIDRIERKRLTKECAKLDPKFEREQAEDVTMEEFKSWPEF